MQEQTVPRTSCLAVNRLRSIARSSWNITQYKNSYFRNRKLDICQLQLITISTTLSEVIIKKISRTDTGCQLALHRDRIKCKISKKNLAINLNYSNWHRITNSNPVGTPYLFTSANLKHTLPSDVILSRTTLFQPISPPCGPCNAPWFSSETLALYKSLTYSLLSVIYRQVRTSLSAKRWFFLNKAKEKM